MSANSRSASTELDLGLRAAAAILGRAGLALDESDRVLLLSHATRLHGASDGEQDRVATLFGSAPRGFLCAAAEGVLFVPTEAFAGELAESIETHYPGAGPQFLRLASSYWTLRMLEGRVRLRHAGIVLQQLLESVCSAIETVFFVDPAGDPVDSRSRRDLQRRTLRDSGARFEIEEFLLGNPLLFGNPLAE